MKKYNVAIVGYGWAAEAHIAAINATPLAQVTAVCSSRKLDPAALAEKHGCPIRAFNDLGEMLAQRDIHAVSVCSYHRQHPAHIIAAARAGKHIIAEKPLALNPRDLGEIEGAVSASGVTFCTCFELRFSSQFREIRSILDRGLLGHVHYAEVDYYHGVGPWYREFLWCTTKEDCGSSLLEAGIHAMDALLLCVGEEVEEVFTYGSKSSHATYAPYEYPPTTSTLVRFKGGAVGKCASVIDCWQPYYFHTHLVGSEGSLLDDRFHSNLIEGHDRNSWQRLAYKPVDSGDVHDHPYQTQFEAFFDAIDRGACMPLTGLPEATRTHEVVFAAMRSLDLGRPVTPAEIRAT
ncbi:MAG: Gfo/Idh/MocA family oxidoreductase [Verrucomicrobiae bacterium]|nr:Gfo/Idh/MocA family oxidoreductase [Verrucomicrobiae bacterium]